MIDAGRCWSMGIDCKTVTLSESTSPEASITHSPALSKMRKPVCAPVFWMRIFIKEASNFSSTISPEIAWDAFITVAKSKASLERLPVEVLLLVVRVEVRRVAVDDKLSNCEYLASKSLTFALAPQRT